MSKHDISDFLGDFAADLDDERTELLAGALATIERRYPLTEEGQDDWLDERARAQGAAAQLAFGDATLAEMVQAWKAAVERERITMSELTGALAYAATGMSEREIATEHDLNRMTVRKALGK